MKSIIIITLLFSNLLYGRINEDIVALESRYGKATFVHSAEGSDGTFATFNFQGKDILAVLIEGDCVLEVIEIGPEKLYSNSDAERVTDESVKFTVGLLESVYNWPKDEALKVIQQLGEPVTHGEMRAKLEIDGVAVKTTETFKAKVIVMTKDMEDDTYRMKVAAVFGSGVVAKSKTSRAQKAAGF
jgi:hypothetical protein